jgi:Na+-transporting NADH:ubiquinone oxidoreductase subunit NqrC
MKFLKCFILTAVLLAPALVADTKIKMEDLPKAVQDAAREQTKGATIVGVAKEVEKGKTMYEVETKVNGLGRDLLFDANGKLVTVEEETTLDKIPAAAKAAIEKKAGTGKITKVETVTQGSVVSYEAVVNKKGKNTEVAVNADGSAHK